MAKINEIDITSLLFQEGSAPSTPASTKWRAYFKTDGLYVIDDAGTETGPLGTSGGSGDGSSAWCPIWTKTTPASEDDEFNDESDMSGETNGLDDKWTAVAGSSGTVDFLETGTVSKYDLATRPGWLLIQCSGGQNVSLRQDFTLADGASVVLPVGVGLNALSGDNLSYALRLNNNDSSSTSGDYVACMVEQDSTEIVVQANTSADATGTELTLPVQIGLPVFLRIVRASLTYHCFVSVSGWAWHWVDSFTFASAMSNAWISITVQSSEEVCPIIAIPWFRVGTDDLDPWS